MRKGVKWLFSKMANESKLSKTTVQHIASLARIQLSAKDLSKFSQELSAILDYINLLNEVNTIDIPLMAQAAGLKNVWREDSPQKEQSLSQKAALSNAPRKENGFFKVKSVF